MACRGYRPRVIISPRRTDYIWAAIILKSSLERRLLDITSRWEYDLPLWSNQAEVQTRPPDKRRIG